MQAEGSHHVPVHLLVGVVAIPELMEQLRVEQGAQRVGSRHLHVVVQRPEEVCGAVDLQRRVLHLLHGPQSLPSVAPVLRHEVPCILDEDA